MLIINISKWISIQSIVVFSINISEGYFKFNFTLYFDTINLATFGQNNKNIN